jgi:hypothetical protein
MGHAALAALLLGLGACGASVQQQRQGQQVEDELLELVTAAERAYVRGDYDQARRLAQQALRYDGPQSEVRDAAVLVGLIGCIEQRPELMGAAYRRLPVSDLEAIADVCPVEPPPIAAARR